MYFRSGEERDGRIPAGMTLIARRQSASRNGRARSAPRLACLALPLVDQRDLAAPLAPLIGPSRENIYQQCKV